MKAENWFQLRIVGVTSIKEPGFGRAFFYRRAQPGRAISFLHTGVSQLRTQQGREHRAQQVKYRGRRA